MSPPFVGRRGLDCYRTIVGGIVQTHPSGAAATQKNTRTEQCLSHDNDSEAA
jgi:hypothetical protein